MPLINKKPKTFNNDRYLTNVECLGTIYIKNQLKILKTFWKPHKVCQNWAEQQRLDYEIEWLEYVLFWKTIDLFKI